MKKYFQNPKFYSDSASVIWFNLRGEGGWGCNEYKLWNMFLLRLILCMRLYDISKDGIKPAKCMQVEVYHEKV